MRFSARLTVALVLFGLLTAGTVGFLAYRNVNDAAPPTVLARLESRARLHAANLNAHMRGERQDVIAVTGMADVEGFVRSHLAGGADPIDKTREADWRVRIARNFEAQLAAKPQYASLRLIGQDGREFVRVDRMGPGGAIRSVEVRQLQDKRERAYLRHTIGLARGEAYVSPLDLRQENGVLETPHVPVVYIASPVASADGKTFGIVIADIDMRPALAELAESPLPGTQVYLVNEEGDYLRHPDATREFGFNLGPRYRVQDDFPAVAEVLASHGTASFETSGREGRTVSLTFFPLRIADGPWVALVETLSLEGALGTDRAVGRAILLGGLIAAVLAMLLAAALSRSFARPLAQMPQRAAEFNGERPPAPPPIAPGERLTEREKLFIAAMENAPDAILTTAPDGVITTWNRGARRLFGYAPEEVIGRHISIIIPPEHIGKPADYMERLRRGERFENLETLRRAKDGSLIDISLSLSPVFGPSGDFIATSAILRDITSRRQAEERFKLAMEASPGAMIMTDAQGTIALVNAEAERMFGYEPGELLGKPIEILIPEQHRADHVRNRDDFARQPQRRTMGAGRDLFGVRKDGSQVAVQIGLNPIKTHNSTMVMAAIVDITVRQRYERVLAERAVELQRSNAELEQFAYVASHDLQEPLRMVASYSELLAERYSGKLDAKADKYIQYAVDGAKRMQRLVNDLLAYSRVGRKEEPAKLTDMNQIAADVLGGLRRAIEQSKAEVEVGPLPTIMVDDRQIGQVLQNLVGNGLKFRGLDRTPKIRIDARQSPEGWLFSVEDNGIGIESQYSERIFQMFQRLHDRQSYEGNGIGLTIAKKIVERHGGRIWFESVPGAGTTFFFTLRSLQEKAA